MHIVIPFSLEVFEKKQMITMIKYKNFKFIIDVTYGALKFKKIYIYYISRTKKNISIFA